MSILSNRIQVVVSGQVFEIPAEKQSELLRLLAGWQSISVSEAQNNTGSARYEGRTLLNG